jgi:uncharacterized protein YwbE
VGAIHKEQRSAFKTKINRKTESKKSKEARGIRSRLLARKERASHGTSFRLSQESQVGDSEHFSSEGKNLNWGHNN